MAETCEFCGTGNFAHKRLVCGAQVARLEGELAEAQTKYDRLLFTHDEVTLPMLYEADERLKVLEAAIRAKDAALRAQGTTGGFAPLGEWHAYGCGMLAGPGVRCLTRCEQAHAALSPDAGEGWVVAKGACNEHPDGCPEGSHRLSPYEAPQPQSRSEERRYRIQGWLPPEAREQVLADIVRVLDAHTGYYSDEFRQELCAALDALKGVE